MKTTGLISTSLLIIFFAVCMTWRAHAQAFHLSTGEALSFGFNAVDGCHFTEGIGGSGVSVLFGIDSLGPPENLRVELLENSLIDTPFAMQVFSPTSSVQFVVLGALGYTHWLDNQGLIRFSMLSGSVDVLSAHFFVALNANGYCDTIVAVPEPSRFFLIVFGSALWALNWFASRKKNEGVHAWLKS